MNEKESTFVFKHLDFMIDFETLGLLADSAPMSVACLPFFRNNANTPFWPDDGLMPHSIEQCDTFTAYVDLRSCVVDGFRFDQQTIDWWSHRTPSQKRSVCKELPEPLTDVLAGLLDYLSRTIVTYEARSVCLWSQGSEMDIAMLKHIASRYGADLGLIIPYTSYRDCRTLVLEAAMATSYKINYDADILENPKLAYNLIPPLPDDFGSADNVHDALYDCFLSAWSTWIALKWLKSNERY